MNYESIPDEMQHKKQWIVWKRLNGQKIPFQAHSLMEGASSVNPEHWNTFPVCVDLVNRSRADGIGFVFNNDYLAVDLDDCMEPDILILPWAEEILRQIGPAYIETSVSGKGLHVIVPHTVSLPGKGLSVRLKDVGLAPEGGVEVYEKGRYFIMTGNVFQDSSTIQGDGSRVIPIYQKLSSLIGRNKETPPKDTDATIFIKLRELLTMDQVLGHYGIEVPRDRKILCPFHGENTPSLHVYQHDYFCFGCQAYGDPTGFVRQHESLPNSYAAARRLDEIFHLGLFPAAEAPLVEKALQKCETDELQRIIQQAFDLGDIPEPDRKIEYVSTGVPTLDVILGGGLGMGQLTVVTGVNASGKSTWLGQLLLDALEGGHNPFAYSGELIPKKFQSWLDLQAAGRDYINAGHYASGEQYAIIKPGVEEMIHNWYRGRFFLYNNRNGTKIQNLLQVMEAYAIHKQTRFFLLDNLMMLDLDASDKDEYQNQSRMIRELAKFAQDHMVHIVVVAHPRKVTTGVIRKVDISGSGDIANRADTIIAVHRCTPDFIRETTNLKLGQERIIMASTSSNIIEVFKSRDTCAAEVQISMGFDAVAKRLFDNAAKETRDRRYSWDSVAARATMKPF